MTTYIEIMQKKIEDLKGDKLIGTNAGTYSATEAHAAIGVGDPQFADYRIFESITGSRRTEGCDPDKAPGRTRWMGASAKQRQADIKELMGLIANEKTRPSHKPVSYGVIEACR